MAGFSFSVFDFGLDAGRGCLPPGSGMLSYRVISSWIIVILSQIMVGRGTDTRSVVIYTSDLIIL